LGSSLRARRTRREQDNERRGHVRPLDETPTRLEEATRVRATGSSRSHVRPKSDVQRIRPLSEVSSTGRRADRRRARVTTAAPKTRRRIRPLYLLSWRAVSGMIVLGLGVVLYVFLTAEAFIVNAVAIGAGDGSGNFVDLKYLTPEEIFGYSEIAGKHIFWVDPREVERKLEQVPNIAQARVTVGWPPNLIRIEVIEREPALTWEQSVRVWVDVNGVTMKQREDRPDLLRIVVANPEEPIGPNERIPKPIIDGALYLRSRFPNVEVLLYDPVKGLGYHDSRGWTVWFGGGEEMDVKLRVYLATVRDIEAQGIQPGEIFMGDPDRPYYTMLYRQGQ